MIRRFEIAAAVAVALMMAGPASAAIALVDQIPMPASPGVDLVEIADIDATSVLVQTGFEDGAQALVEQTGLGAESLIVQDSGLDGGGLYALVFQSAPGAQSTIMQSGSMNQAFVYQTVNAGSVSTIVQSGTGNIAIVRQ